MSTVEKPRKAETMTIDEMIDVLTAAKAGKAIQFRELGALAEWQGWTGKYPTVWNFGLYDYREKPEPRRVWVNEYNGSINNGTCAYTQLESAEVSRREQTDARSIEFTEVLK